MIKLSYIRPPDVLSCSGAVSSLPEDGRKSDGEEERSSSSLHVTSSITRSGATDNKNTYRGLASVGHRGSSFRGAHSGSPSRTPGSIVINQQRQEAEPARPLGSDPVAEVRGGERNGLPHADDRECERLTDGASCPAHALSEI